MAEHTTLKGKAVEETRGNPGDIHAYASRARDASDLLDQTAGMLSAIVDNKVTGMGFSLNAVRNHGTETSEFFTRAANLFREGAEAFRDYANHLEDHKQETRDATQEIEDVFQQLEDARSALAAAESARDSAPEEERSSYDAEIAGLEAEVARLESEYDRLRGLFDYRIKANHDAQDKAETRLRDAAQALREIEKSVDNYRLSGGSNPLQTVLSLGLWLVPGGGVAKGLRAVTAGIMAVKGKMWLDGERSDRDMLLDILGLAPVRGARAAANAGRTAGVIGDEIIARLERGEITLDEALAEIATLPLNGAPGTGAERILSPEAAQAEARQSKEIAEMLQRAGLADAPGATTLTLNDANNMPVEYVIIELPGGNAVIALDLKDTEALTRYRATLSPDQLGDPRYDPTHPRFLGMARGQNLVTGPIGVNQILSRSGETFQGALDNGRIPEGLQDYIGKPDSPLMIVNGEIHFVDPIQVDVPASMAKGDRAEFEYQLAMTELGMNQRTVHEHGLQVETYHGKTNRLDPQGPWKKSLENAYVADESRRIEEGGGTANEAALRQQFKDQYSGMHALHSPDQYGGGHGYGVTGWGGGKENNAISKIWPSTRDDIASEAASRLDGIPEEYWDDIRMNVEFNITDDGNKATVRK